MKLHFAMIPAVDPGPATEALNQFLATHRVAQVQRELVADGAQSYWAVCVTYVDGAAKPAARGKRGVDYKQVLPADQFRVFSRLREVRKSLADADGVPAYAVFTNEHLAEMVRRSVETIADLKALPGVGEARTEKYGAAMLDALREATR